MTDADADIPAWEIARKKRCFKQFIKLKCVKSGHDEIDADADDFDITLLDVRKMKTHILDCVMALGIVQQELVSHEQLSILQEGEQSIAKEQQEASNKVFKASLSTMATAMLHDGTDVPKQSGIVGGLIEIFNVDRLLRAFPDESKQTDGRSWLPLHWAVVIDEESVTEADVEAVYTSDPMALQRKHLDCTDSNGYTPAHVLCMHEITQRNMSLIKHFSICNSGAFTMSANDPRGDSLRYSFTTLHATCCYGQPTEELLKHLLQLDSSQTRKMSFENGCTPLGYLCANINCNDRLIACLLEVDSSAEVVWNGIRGCLQFTNCSCVLERLDMLHKANPEAVKCRDVDGMNLLHLAAQFVDKPIQECIDFMQRIVAVHKDALREVDSNGWLPVHTAAQFSTVEVMEYLLGLYPESASVVTADGSLNFLHLAVCDRESTTSVVEAKVRFLCSRYPAMTLQRDDSGNTPLHDKIIYFNFPVVQILCEAGGQEQIRAPVVHPTDVNNYSNGWLSLHILLFTHSKSLRDSPLSKEANCFRLLLRMYPEAVGIQGGVEVIVDGEDEDDEDNEEDAPLYRKTPYQIAVDEDLPPYYLRLLLRATPNLNPAELHRLNYAERRMVMFLAFKAVTSQKKPVVLKRLCFENKDLVKYVVSFL